MVFAGSPDFAATILSALQDSAFPCGLVLSQPDRPRGRGRRLAQSPVKKLALELGLPVAQPASLKDRAAAQELEDFEPDVLVVAAYGLLLPQYILDIPALGCLNVHASLLPRWRGAAPIERAVMAGDTETGIAIMRMEKGLDTGPVFASKSVAIDGFENILQLENQLALNGAQLLIDVLNQLIQEPALQPSEQLENGVTYAHKLDTADRIIDWRQGVKAIERQIWALNRRMPAITYVEGVQVQILDACLAPMPVKPALTGCPGRQLPAGKKSLLVECGDGVLAINELKINRGKGLPMDSAAAKNGYPDLFNEDGVFFPTSGQTPS